jgi:hypothetical protein
VLVPVRVVLAVMTAVAALALSGCGGSGASTSATTSPPLLSHRVNFNGVAMRVPGDSSVSAFRNCPLRPDGQVAVGPPAAITGPCVVPSRTGTGVVFSTAVVDTTNAGNWASAPNHQWAKGGGEPPTLRTCTDRLPGAERLLCHISALCCHSCR